MGGKKTIILQVKVDTRNWTPFRKAKLEFEIEYVKAVLDFTGWNITKAARLAGKCRRDFLELRRRTGVGIDDFREPTQATQED